MDQTEIIKRCKQGQSEYFEELYNLYCDKALGMAFIISGSRGIAEDIVQEAFTACFLNIKRINTPDAFNIWFYRTLVRIGWRMVKKYRKATPSDEIIGILDHHNAENNTYDSIDNDYEVLRNIVNNLKYPLKTVIVLHYFNDMSVKDISRVLSCFEGTVKSRLHTARKILKSELQKNFKDDDFYYFEKEGKSNG